MKPPDPGLPPGGPKQLTTTQRHTNDRRTRPILRCRDRALPPVYIPFRCHHSVTTSTYFRHHSVTTSAYVGCTTSHDDSTFRSRASQSRPPFGGEGASVGARPPRSTGRGFEVPGGPLSIRERRANIHSLPYRTTLPRYSHRTTVRSGKRRAQVASPRCRPIISVDVSSGVQVMGGGGGGDPSYGSGTHHPKPCVEYPQVKKASADPLCNV